MSNIKITPDGQHFLHTCPHCGGRRQERVDPAVNPDPFCYLPTCLGCCQPVEVDHAYITAVQASYARARSPGKKYPACTEAQAGSEEESKSSPVRRHSPLLAE